MCLMGGILKSITGPYKVGDRIDIAGFRGDVLSHDFFVTHLHEIGPGRLSHQYTGRRVVLPNSLLLSAGVINETKRYRFGLHTFTVSLPASVDVVHHRDVLLAAANEVCHDYISKAQAYLIQLGKSTGLEAPSADPRVSISFSTGIAVDLVVRVPIPALKSGSTEQEILSKYIEKRQPVLAADDA